MKKTKILLSTMIMAAALSMTAYAGEWIKDPGEKWWYQDDDGGYPAGEWKLIGEKEYYFGEDGYMLVNTIAPDGRQVGPDGSLVEGEAKPVFEYSVAPFDLKYTGHNIVYDVDAKKCVAIFYDVTNKTEEPLTADTAGYTIKLTQNDIKCTEAKMSAKFKNASYLNYKKEILPGETMNVAVVFSLVDMSDATVQVEGTMEQGNAETVTGIVKLQ